MTHRLVLHLAMLALLLLATRPALAQSIEDVILDRAAAHGVSGPALVALAQCESRLDPFAVGSQGEVGLFQLLPRVGLLPTFYAWGYGNPWSAWEQSDFTARAIAAGMRYHWHC